MLLCFITPSHKPPNLDTERKREMGMKVFGPPKFTNVARVLVCLEEVGAEYEVVLASHSVGVPSSHCK
ncbi:glutathione S-transferase GSTF1 [Carex littledalei]|uniref:Glutathione S-transferase GSTF1 n=1 Tax=Carex littledalei TaxID=544730 RepID=A0A833QBM8_9POAL|nr:glutathione S-transferase GSTF1 [Carex littledalei]